MKDLPWLLAVPGTLETGRTIVLDPSEAHHVTGALRRRMGDEIVLTDGEGGVAQARLISLGKGRVEAEVLSVHREPASDSEGVTVALAMVSGRNMDWAVQKTVEIGVFRFVPIVTERSQHHRGEDGARTDHWRRVSMQALKQCRRPWAMKIGDVVSLQELLDSELAAGGGVISDREGCSIGELPASVGKVLVVGPEGGFTEAELVRLDDHGWPRLCLGLHVLRAETAAVVGGAMLVARSEQLKEKG